VYFSDLYNRSGMINIKVKQADKKKQSPCYTMY